MLTSTFLLITSPVSALADQIVVSNVEAEALEADAVRLSISAQGDGVEVGSYYIRLFEMPEEKTPPAGFFSDRHKNHYLDTGTTGTNRMNFADNSTRDESPADGTFSITLPTTGWPDGRYELEIGAHNRPATGKYIVDRKRVEIRIANGEATAEVITNPEIRLVRFDVEQIDEHRTKVTFEAEGRGIPVGSFAARLDRRPEGKLPPGFITHAQHDYLAEPSAKSGSPEAVQLKDNGPLDEDPRRNVFAITLDTRQWPKGSYALGFIAHNRPAPGPYLSAKSEYVELNVGKKASEAAAKPISNIPGAEHGIVYQEEGIYACFPSIYQLPDDRLIVSMGTRTKRSHIDTTGGIGYRISSDGGRTWEPTSERMIRKEWKTPEGRYITADSEGWVHFPTSEMAAYKAQNKYINPGEVHPGTSAYLGGVSSRTSLDNGATWEKTPVEIEDCVGVLGYNKAANELVTSKGVHLIAFYGYRASLPHSEGASVFLVRTDDQGKTWTGRPMYPEPPTPNLTFNETALVETADGRILALMRIALSDPQDDSFLWIAESTDDGLTWSQPRRTEIWGYPACARRLPNGDLIAVYGYRRRPMGIRAAVSRDNGQTWDVKNEMILRDDALGAGGDNGYPMLHLFDDGEILAVYYLTTANNMPHIGYTRFRIPESDRK